MIEFLSICVLILIVCVAVLFWYVGTLNSLLQKSLELIRDNYTLINKVSNVVFDIDEKMIDIWKRHLEVHHGAIFEESEVSTNEQ